MMPHKDGMVDLDVLEAIRITRLCEALHCLPKPGGLFDQDSYHVWLMEQVLAADAEKAALEETRRKNEARHGK